MRLLIYLLAMLTGFSAAEAARPVSAVPASVGAEIGQAYAAVAVDVAQKSQDGALPDVSALVSIATAIPASASFDAIQPTTPIHRHDVILG